ncbi:MAG: TetR-like C-terminal domain-containing protein, partial [Polyangiaceae bacterium]
TAVASEGFRMLESALRVPWESNGKGLRGFQAQGEAYVRFALENPWHYRVMFGSGFELEADDAELNANGAAAFAVLVEALVEQQAQGLVRKDEPQLQANFVWAAVHGVAMLAIDGNFAHQGSDPSAIARYAVARIQSGIGVR